MILKHRVALNGVQLDELDERILVLGVNDGAAKEAVSTVSLFGGVGQRVAARHRESLDVIVRFGLRIKAGDLQGRSELFERVAGWAAGGGWLTVNYRPNRRIYVTCAQLPAPGDLVEWNGEYSITFRAYGVPYWMQESITNFAVESTRATTRTLVVPGTAATVLEVNFTNLSGMEIATATISAGGCVIALENLHLGPWEILVLDHDENGLLRIRIAGASGWRSAMACRTAWSSDDLTVRPGPVNVSFTAQRAGQLVVGCYGRYA